MLRKKKVSKVEPSRNQDVPWEGPYKIMKAHENRAYTLADNDGRQLAKTWNPCLSVFKVSIPF